MLYHLSDPSFVETFGPLRIFKFISFRALGGAATAFAFSVIFGPAVISWLRRLKFGQQVREEHVGELFKTHAVKQGTPTMGGVLMLAALTVSVLLWAVPNGFVLIALATTLYMGFIGMCDDLLKITKKNTKGLSSRKKLAMQLIGVLGITWALLNWEGTAPYARRLMVPFMKAPLLDDMSFLMVFAFFYIVIAGASNAVNLTDGLDGLAVGCTGTSAFAYLVMAYVAGHAIFADYLFIPFIPGAGELTVFCGCLMGACLGFLWFNCHPAQVFMGDTGSLALGGAVGIVAVLINQELSLLIVGGVFVMEAASVMMQVGYFKLTGGKRIFRCTPIHHHFELIAKERVEAGGEKQQKVIENMVTVRLWIVSLIFALLGIATLKIR